MCDHRCSCPTCSRLANHAFATAYALAQAAARDDRAVAMPDFARMPGPAFAEPALPEKSAP